MNKSLNHSLNKFIQKHWFRNKTSDSLWINHWVIDSTNYFSSLADMVIMNCNRDVLIFNIKSTFSYTALVINSRCYIWFAVVKSKVFRHWWFHCWANCFFKKNAVEERIGSGRGQEWTWQDRNSGIDGWKKWIEKKKRGEERSVTPEHIKYFMRCVVQQRQERAWSERLAQLIYSTGERERERESERALRGRCVCFSTFTQHSIIHYNTCLLFERENISKYDKV